MFNIDDLKKIIKRSPRASLCLYILKNKIKDPQACAELLDLEKSPLSVKYEHRGDFFVGKTVYIITISECWKTGGYCYLLRMTLLHMAYADRMKFIPYVDWPKDIAYAEEYPINGVWNSFEYFFENGGITKEQAERSDLLVRSKIYDALFYKSKQSYMVEEEEIELLSCMIKKYLYFNKNGQKEIGDIAVKIKERGKVLGVHVRGTDYRKNYNKHPKEVTVEEYLDKAIEIFYQGRYEFVFLATDEENVIDKFASAFGKKLIFHEVYRSASEKPVHLNNDIQRKNNKYLLGKEILLDLYSLSWCDGLIAGMSNVSIIARALRRSRGDFYRDEVIIDKGINHNNHVFK